MLREELTKKTVKELAQMCKERSIPHYRGKNVMKKAELIELLCNATIEESSDSEEVSPIERQHVKDEFIEKATAGQLIAFYEHSGKLQTAALVARNKKLRKLRLVTQYNKQYEINYEDVAWVRSPGKRWPSQIYAELKARGANNEKEC